MLRSFIFNLLKVKGHKILKNKFFLNLEKLNLRKEKR